MLLNPCWLVPLAAERGVGLVQLVDIARLACASIEETALQLAWCGVSNASVIVWEPGYRKSERDNLSQAALPGFEGTRIPHPRLRAVRCYAPADAPFIPVNKSALPGSTINRRAAACATQTANPTSCPITTRTASSVSASSHASNGCLDRRQAEAPALGPPGVFMSP